MAAIRHWPCRNDGRVMMLIVDYLIVILMMRCVVTMGDTDTDTVTDGFDKCLIEDICPDNSDCESDADSYNCSCSDGYEEDEISQCIDIDECNTDDDNTCDSTSETCVNTDGSYMCECASGYLLDGDNVCQDIDECVLPGLNECEQICVNSDGSYTCICNDGFTLNDGDGYSCTVDTVCVESNCSQLCANVDGTETCLCSEYYEADNDDICVFSLSCDDGDICDDICTQVTDSIECSCTDGYELQADGVSCTDIDECSVGTDNCSVYATCANTDGGFTCECSSGYEGDGVTCDVIDYCEDSPCSTVDHSTCTSGSYNYTCICDTGYYYDDTENICQPGGASYILNLTLYLEYTSTLSDPSSTDFKTMATKIIDALDQKFAGLEGYTTSVVIGFSNGSVVSEVEVITDTPTSTDSLNSSITDDCGTSVNGVTICVLGDLPMSLYVQASETTWCDLTDRCPSMTECVEWNGSYNCSCASGYETLYSVRYEGVAGFPYIDICDDVDECDGDDDPCSGGEECINIPGGYVCQVNCTDYECNNGGTLRYTNNGTVNDDCYCSCEVGYVGDHCETYSNTLLIALIAVSCVCGVIIILLLAGCIIFICRRNKKVNGSFTSEQDLTYSSRGVPRAYLHAYDNVEMLDKAPDDTELYTIPHDYGITFTGTDASVITDLSNEYY